MPPEFTTCRSFRRSSLAHHCSLTCAQVYTIWSILAIVFIILIIVTAFITVALTYFQLATEDHAWWWRSFLCGGSTGAHFQALVCWGAVECK